MGFMTQMHVWDNVPRAQAPNDPDGKIVGTRWVFVKKDERSDADLSPRSSQVATREMISTPVPLLWQPPDISSQTVSIEDEETSEGS